MTTPAGFKGFVGSCVFSWMFLILYSPLTYSLVVTEPCCHVFQHRGAMFGPELPVKAESIFDYIPERPRISSVEGPLKLTDKSNPALCRPDNVARQNYHFVDSIALIPRGACSFAEKVYVAQLLGAKAAIVFQAKDSRDSASGVMTGTGNDDVIVMAEDSRYGNLVDIPSAFISYNSWMHILALLKEAKGSTPEGSEDYYTLEDLLDVHSGRGLRQSDEKRNETKFKSGVKGQTVDYEATYAKRMEEFRSLDTSMNYSLSDEIGLSERQLSKIQEDFEKKTIYVVINETGSLPSTGPDALPMMWDSMIFLIKVFIIIWSVMGFAYVSNWVKMRYRKLKRQHVIRSLPCKKYKKLQFHSSSKSLLSEKKPTYEKIGQVDANDIENNFPEPSEKDNLLNREENDISEDNSITLEEYTPRPTVNRQGSDLKLRNSPRKKRSKELGGSGSSSGSSSYSDEHTSSIHSESDAIECDNCVICLCEFELEEFVTVLPCKHIYHKECIEPWLVNKSSLCPICKQSIFKNGESRSINELNETDTEENLGADYNEHGEQRGNSVAMSIAMFFVIIISFTFIMSDDNE